MNVKQDWKRTLLRIFLWTVPGKLKMHSAKFEYHRRNSYVSERNERLSYYTQEYLVSEMSVGKKFGTDLLKD